MFSVKNASVSAAAGFVLSFLISIISTGKPLVSFVRGIIFAAVFAGLSCAVDFVSGKFLDQGGKSLEAGDEAEKKPAARTGSVVNITIDDEDLTEEEQAPAFDISANANRTYALTPAEKNSALSAEIPQGSAVQEPVSAPEKEAEAAAAPAPAETKNEEPVSVQPESPAPAADSVKKEELPAKSEAADKKAQAQAEHIAQVQEIDSLPDIGALSENAESESSGSIISSSDFAQAEDVPPESSPPSGSPDSLDHDTKTIASAIRTLLKKDEM